MLKRLLSWTLQILQQRKARLTAYSLIALAALLIASVVRGANAPPNIPWRVFSGGGAPASSANYTLDASLGQTAIGDASDTSVHIGSGYWYGAIQADLILTKVASNNPVLAGGPLQYSLQVTNQGPHSATNIILVDKLSTSVVFVAASPGCNYESGSHSVTCILDTVDMGSSAVVTIDTTVISSAYGSAITNEASVMADQVDPNLADNVALISISVIGGEIIYENDFEEPVGKEWSCTTIRRDTTPIGKRKFLGQFNKETVCLILNNIPAHDWITVSFDVYIIRSWNGNQKYEGNQNQTVVGPDQWDLRIQGNTVFNTTFSNFLGHNQAYPKWYPDGNYIRQTGAVEKSTLGYTFIGQIMDSVYRLTYTVPHNLNTLQVDFTGNLLPTYNLEDESWGLDNIVVSVAAGINQVYLPLVYR